MQFLSCNIMLFFIKTSCYCLLRHRVTSFFIKTQVIASYIIVLCHMLIPLIHMQMNPIHMLINLIHMQMSPYKAVIVVYCSGVMSDIK